MKRIVSLALILAVLLAIMPLTIFATEQNAELIDIDIYKAQCMAGTAVDNSVDNRVERCRNLYNYYVDEELFSSTKTFLDEAYANDVLMMNFKEWKVYSLGADASAALNQPMKEKDYYESLILAMLSQTISEMDDTKIEADATATAVIDNLCSAANVTTKAALISHFSKSSTSAVKSAIESARAGTDLASDALLVVDTVIGASSTIVDAVERIALYNQMLELDKFAKQWLEQMYNACDSETDVALKTALSNLKNASISFASSLLVEIKDTSFRTATWMAGATVNTALGVAAGTNPISAAVLTGLKFGKTICDIFYKTSDVYEQFFMLECVYNVEALAKEVVKNSEFAFNQNETNENAKTFIYAVMCYFECLIDVEVDCMINFLDILYNGGILKGSIVWFYGATDDYQEAVNVLESLRDTRIKNYDLMELFFRAALDFNYPDTFNHYFTVDTTVPITDISFITSRILPPPYPAGYANMIVGDFANLYVQYEPSNTTQQAYTATSDNLQVVTVKDNIMTAVSEGTANVTVTSVENPDVSYTAEIKVGAKLENTEPEGLTTWLEYTVSDGKATITGLVDGYNPSRLTIPSKINGYSITAIGNSAFRSCTGFTSITIPNSITAISASAFENCTNLSNINLPNTLKDIYPYAFSGCTSLKTINIPDSVERIGSHAFNKCGELIYVKLPVNWNHVIDYKYHSGWVEYTESPFVGCSSLKSVTIPNGATLIPTRAFYNAKSLEAITIPNSVVAINEGAFQNCQGIDDIEIPMSVTTIGKSVFAGCTGFTSITIPESVTSIGSNAFSDCNNLKNVIYNGTVADWSNIFIDDGNEPLLNAENIFFTCKHEKGSWNVKEDNTKEKVCKECGAVTETLGADEYIPYDVTGDNKVNMIDYMRVKLYYFNLVELTDDQFARADLTGDGKVNMFDYMKLKTAVLAQ